MSDRFRLEVRITKDQPLPADLVEQIIEFDKRNMKAILDKAGLEFPEEKRRQGLHDDPTLIIAFGAQRIAGYLQYGRSWNNPNYIYVGSLQIERRYRNSRLLIELLDGFRSLMSKEDFDGFETNIQKVNSSTVKLCQKLGFRLEQNPRNEASWLALAGRDLLQTSRLGILLDRWGRRRVALNNCARVPDDDDNS